MLGNADMELLQSMLVLCGLENVKLNGAIHSSHWDIDSNAKVLHSNSTG